MYFLKSWSGLKKVENHCYKRTKYCAGIEKSIILGELSLNRILLWCKRSSHLQ